MYFQNQQKVGVVLTSLRLKSVRSPTHHLRVRRGGYSTRFYIKCTLFYVSKIPISNHTNTFTNFGVLISMVGLGKNPYLQDIHG